MDIAEILQDADKKRLYVIAHATLARAGNFAWYDSNFLRRYHAALSFIRVVRPERATEFEDAFRILRTDPAFFVRHVTEALDPKSFQEILDVVASLSADAVAIYELQRFGRGVLQNHPAFNALQESLLEEVSALAGEPLCSGYNFLSLYSGSGRCEPHMDEPEAKWTFDLCLAQSTPWPIYFSPVTDWPEKGGHVTADSLRQERGIVFDAVTLHPNEAALFSGSSQWHYRDPIPGGHDAFCHLLFLHYSPVGTKQLVRPDQWPELFDIPELEIMGQVFYDLKARERVG